MEKGFRGLAGAAAAVTGLTVVQKVVGFLTELAVAGSFGATAATDAYLVGLTLPQMATQVTVTGLSLSLIPALAAARAREGGAAPRRRARQVLAPLTLGGLLFSLLGVWAAPWFLAPVAAGWPPELQEVAVLSARLAFPAVAVAAGAAVLRALLNAHEVFLYTPVGVILENLAMAAVAVLLTAYGPVVLAGGYLVGVLLHLLVYLVAWSWLRGRLNLAGLQPPVDPEGPAAPAGLESPQAAAGRLFFPLLVWSLLVQAPVVVERAFSTLVPAGAVSAYTYAYKLRQFPMETAVQAVATVFYPALAAAVSLGRPGDLAQTAQRALRLALLASLPAAAGLFLLADPIVRLVYQRGAFDIAAAALTAGSLAGYAPGIPALALAMVLGYLLFAAGRPWLPVLALATGLLVQAGAGMLLLPALGVPALPWAASGAALWAAAVMAYQVRRSGVVPLNWRAVIIPPLLATVPVAVMSGALSPFLSGLEAGGPLAAGVLGTIAAAAAVYLLVLARIQLPEVALIWERLPGSRRWGRG